MLLRLIELDGGDIRFEGRDLLTLRGEELRSQRRQMQMVFQDPFASLNPRMRVGEIVAEPLAISRARPLSYGAPCTRGGDSWPRRHKLKTPCRGIPTNSPAASASASALLAL